MLFGAESPLDACSPDLGELGRGEDPRSRPHAGVGGVGRPPGWLAQTPSCPHLV